MKEFIVKYHSYPRIIARACQRISVVLTVLTFILAGYFSSFQYLAYTLYILLVCQILGALAMLCPKCGHNVGRSCNHDIWKLSSYFENSRYHWTLLALDGRCKYCDTILKVVNQSSMNYQIRVKIKKFLNDIFNPRW